MLGYVSVEPWDPTRRHGVFPLHSPIVVIVIRCDNHEIAARRITFKINITTAPHERRLRGNTRARLNGTGVMSAPRGSNPVFREARRPLVVLALMVLLSMLQSQSVEIVGAILEVTARMFYFTLGL